MYRGHIRSRSFLVPLVAYALTVVPAAAQDQDNQLWLNGRASAAIADGVDLQFETNHRFGDADGGLYESEYLLALGREFESGLEILGGVNRVIGLEDGRVANTEWRPRQQIGFPLWRLGGGEFAGRIRFEQRFRRGSDDIGVRVLPEIAYSLPLARSVDLRIAHESYFPLNDTDFGQTAGHERMRNSAAMAFGLPEKFRIEVGYMNQYRFNGDEPDVMEHALTLSGSVDF